MTEYRVLRGEQWANDLLQLFDETGLPPHLWMERHTQVVKDDKYSRVGLFLFGDNFSYLKLYQAKGSLQSLWFRAGRSRAVRSYDVGLALRDTGIPVPEPRACVASGASHLLLTQGLPGARDLNGLWLSGQTLDRQLYWMQQSAELLGRLHRQGFVHGDAKWTNLLCQGEKLWLVDLDGVRRGDYRASARDLARFTLNAEDRELDHALYDEFLEKYLEASEQSRAAVMAAMAPFLVKLRRRHRRQYGERGKRLVE